MSSHTLSVFSRNRLSITAHRGWSTRYPENTLKALQTAVNIGCDLVEFDLRASKEQEPIVLHDATLERTTNGTGSPNNYTLDQLAALNASYWQGSHHAGQRLDAPTDQNARIPTFAAILQSLAGQISMNIQIKETYPTFLRRVCVLYKTHNLYETAYLTLDSFAIAERIRNIDPKIELCVLQDRTDIAKHAAYGCVACQPKREETTADLCRQARKAGMQLNMFWADTPQAIEHYVNVGLSGILTNAPDVALSTMDRIVHTDQ